MLGRNGSYNLHIPSLTGKDRTEKKVDQLDVDGGLLGCLIGGGLCAHGESLNECTMLETSHAKLSPTSPHFYAFSPRL